MTSQAKQPDVEQEDDMEKVNSEEQPYSSEYLDKESSVFNFSKSTASNDA